MTSDGGEVAQCDVCGDVIPVKSPRGDAIEPIRPGESCECGEEEFRLLSKAEVDDLSDENLSARGAR